jgi:hypothetical protein
MTARWTDAEDDHLRQLMDQFGKQWSVIASHIPHRSAAQIAERWEKCINPILTKGQFSSSEDQLIRDYVAEHGIHAWARITTVLPHRSSKQCRERWFNNLDPEITKGGWTPEEDRMIFEAYVSQGPKWAQIAHQIPGRSDNAIKNRWNASISKRVIVGDNDRPELAPGRMRKYTRRAQARPPPIIAPPPLDLTALVITPSATTPRVWLTPTMERQEFEIDELEHLRMHSPAFSNGFSLFSPTAYGLDF